MKAIVELTPSEIEKFKASANSMFYKCRGVDKHDLILDLRKAPGYAKYEFSGTISDRFVKLMGRVPTEDEIIIFVDGGFNHFGAHCTIMDRRFVGWVYID